MKSQLTKVTFTGADDTVDPARLVAMSAEYARYKPGFDIEWGILVGSQTGHRFPTHEWIVRLLDLSAGLKPNLSLHICGKHLRSIAAGNSIISALKFNLSRFQRCQLNWHAEPQGDIASEIVRAFWAMDHHWKPQVIFQLDGVNETLACECASRLAPRMSGLFDLSHGAGVLPKEWPACTSLSAAYEVGYAGGLGPDNIREQLPRIHAVAAGDYWIDMETKLFDGLQFSMVKCNEVLEAVQDFIIERREGSR